MQRRAAAAYVALFVAIAAAASYALMTGRLSGKTPHLWAVASLSAITAVVLLASAYMPVRGD